MTIISQKGGNYWIESFVIPRTLISAGSALNTELTLERAGSFLSVSMVLDNSMGAPPLC